MSKEKTLRTLEETEVMQTAGIPAQETEGANVVLATEIIADLKKQLEDAKEEANNLEKTGSFVHSRDGFLQCRQTLSILR